MERGGYGNRGRLRARCHHHRLGGDPLKDHLVRPSRRQVRNPYIGGASRISGARTFVSVL